MASTVDLSRYGDLCRLCATKTTLILGIHIFENEGSLREVRKKIECCLPLQIHQTDALPKMICESCLYKLELLFEFRERSVRTEKLLQDLVKELDNEKIQQEGALNVISMDHNGLIMIPDHHLIGHQIQNVQMDLSHLNQRDSIVVEHNLILAQSHQSDVNLDPSSQSLASLDLNHHDFTTQDLSNHSLQAQEALLMNSANTHDLHDAQFTEENLDMIHQQNIMHQQHQILQEQYRLPHELTVENITLEELSHSDAIHQMQRDKHEMFSGNKGINQMSYSHTRHQNVSSEHCNIQMTSDSSSNDNIKLESLSHHEDSNNTETQLLIENDRLSSEEDKMYLLQQHNDLLDRINANTTENIFCNVCGSDFSSKESFEEHYTSHFTKCHICFVVYTSEDMLNAHIKQEHQTVMNEIHKTLPMEEIKPIKTRLKRAVKSPNKVVETCDDNNEDGGNYDDNREASNPTREAEEVKNDIKEGLKPNSEENKSQQRKKWTPKVCKECGKVYTTNYKLNEHMRKHTGEKPYKCGSCEKSFRSKIGLAQHEAKHTGQYEFSCPTCGKGFQCRSYLMVHQRVHSDVKPWPCSTCGANFKTKQSLLDHTNRHLGVKPFICDVCGRGFITKGLCKAHQKIHNGLDNRKYSCKICNKMFVSKSYLQTHLKIHTGEKPYACEVCNKGFLTRVDLKIHSTLHTGEKAYVCEICGKAFARRDALRCHRRSHTGERPYSCDICGQTFTQFTPMAIHKRLHTGERPYSCEVCKKTFVSRSTMMSHAKKHVT
ncbi:zinc finger protein 260-like [Coccinella septempunctata]|uniref:zinc finger protein 260-like n=1 Tax=Coccinella septempunctata TaxID=41139 RepID=UPI001D07672C|nr:zinc finger protein 260-like [Coccinella septempunctata]